MTKQDKAAQRADQVLAFVQHISQDKQVLETLVGLGGERGYEIDIDTLRSFLELSSAGALDQLTDADLEPVAGGLGGRTYSRGTGPTRFGAPRIYTGVNDPIESAMGPMKHSSKDGQIGPQKSKMKAG